MTVVGISIADPDPGDLAARGLGKPHLEHAFLDLARQLLAAGYTLAYGGDLRLQGYTERLADLLRAHSEAERPRNERIRLLVPWPHWSDASPEERWKVKQVAQPKESPAPDGAGDERALFARALAIMRVELNEMSDARVVLGGKVQGMSGLLPGIAEEAWLAARDGEPVFVAGGFGGCAAVLASLIQGGDAPQLTLEHQLEHTKGYAQLVDALGEPPFGELRAFFRDRGWEALNNGLDEDENRQLFATPDLDLFVALVLRGLRRRFAA